MFRGYKLPIIYLYEATEESYGLRQDRLEIIDGQQRMESLYRFAEGALRLYDLDDQDATFPAFLREKPCPWGGRTFPELSEALQEDFLNSELHVAFIESDDLNEIRELFVRLQAGADLNPQERRDSLPGGFCEFILALGGKPAILRFPGHRFFPDLMGLNPGRSRDRGKTRHMAAQLAGLLLERHENGKEFTDIENANLNKWYHENLDFDPHSAICKRLNAILTKLHSLLHDGKRKLKGHDAIHLTLFLDSIWEDYTRGWETGLPEAQQEFSRRLAEATPTKRNPEPADPHGIWSNYGIWTRSSANKGYAIKRRHAFYSRMMLDLLGDVTPKDPRRSFNAFEREIVYLRQNRKCAVCDAEVDLDEVELHHVVPHSEGGETILENAKMVHRHCHPKGQRADAFRQAV